MIQRITTMVGRYILLNFRSPARAIDLFFWPTMELMVWGFLALYIARTGDDFTSAVLVFVSAIIFWDILYRSQQAVSLAFMEELWTRNVLNLLISPLKISEWVLSAWLYSFLKTFLIVIIMTILAGVMYAYSPEWVDWQAGLYLGNLLLFGFSVGLFTTGLLLRWGHSAEVLIWGIPFLLQPFSAIFYPVAVYPEWLQPICLALPSTHIMEALRDIGLGQKPLDWSRLTVIIGLNIVYMLLCSLFFVRMFIRGRDNGKLVRLTD